MQIETMNEKRGELVHSCMRSPDWLCGIVEIKADVKILTFLGAAAGGTAPFLVSCLLACIVKVTSGGLKPRLLLNCRRVN